MATILARVEDDYKQALKAGDRLRVDTLRLIKAGVQKAAIDKRKDSLDDQEVIQVLSQQAKQRRETIEAAKQSSREDVLSQTTKELAILTSYLPEQLSEAEVGALIDAAIAEVGRQQGAIMKHVMAKTAGRADGKTVSALVAKKLQS
jgi:uncharacterized protein YqeY